MRLFSSVLRFSRFRAACLAIALIMNPGFATATDAPKSAVKKALAKKYPREAIVNWCDGNFLGKPGDIVAVLSDESRKQFRVVWVTTHKNIQELQSVSRFSPDASFELKCLDATKAKELQNTLRTSESIVDFLKIPEGAGALCYFTDYTTAQCWSADKKSDTLIDAGGWQT